MSDRTKIEWCDTTWNVVTGCQKISAGCKNCYAERVANRFWGERKFTDVQVHPERLDQPLHWRKPRRVFVDSMSDLFHPDAVNHPGWSDFITGLWLTMMRTPQHTYMILTKRPAIMEYEVKLLIGAGFPALPNVWLGVSVENQQAADERIPYLLQTPAAVRFLSCEPLLGPVDLTHDLDGYNTYGSKIHWVIAGGESGPGARPMHPDWARSLRDQCEAAGVPFFFKQHGEWHHRSQKVAKSFYYPAVPHIWCWEDGSQSIRVGKSKAGRLLDGREWNEFPEPQP